MILLRINCDGVCETTNNDKQPAELGLKIDDIELARAAVLVAKHFLPVNYGH